MFYVLFPVSCFCRPPTPAPPPFPSKGIFYLDSLQTTRAYLFSKGRVDQILVFEAIKITEERMWENFAVPALTVGLRNFFPFRVQLFFQEV